MKCITQENTRRGLRLKFVFVIRTEERKTQTTKSFEERVVRSRVKKKMPRARKLEIG